MEPLRSSLSDFALPVSHRLVLSRHNIRRFRAGLSFKLLVVVVGVSLIGMLTLSFLLLSSIREQFIQRTEDSAVSLTGLLVSSLQHAMLTHDSHMLNTIVEEAAINLKGGKIQILDSQGFVRSSSSPAEIGVQIELNTSDCQSCHLNGAVQASRKVALADSSLNNMQVLLSATPIGNHSECNGCHDPQMSTLGVMITQIPLNDLSVQIQDAYRRVGLASVLTFTLLVGLMIYALRKVVTEPVNNLSKGVAAIGDENLDYPVRVDSEDELGDLAKSFNTMRIQLKASQEVRQQRNQELSLLFEVASTTGQLLDLQQILSRALNTVVEQMGLETGLIYLYDQTQKRFERVCSRGLSAWQLKLIDQKRQRAGGDLTLDVASKGEIFFVADMSQDPHFTGTFENSKDRSYLNIPLKSKGKIVGTLEVVSQAGQPLSEGQLKILSVVGNQIGIAIDNTSLLKETQRSEREALTLYQLGTETTASLQLDQVLDAIAKGARQVLDGDLGVVGLLEPDSQEFVVRAMDGAQEGDWLGVRVPLSEFGGFSWHSPLVWEQLPADLPTTLARILADERVSSLLVIPLLRGEQSYGIVSVLSRAHRIFIKEEVYLLVRLAQQVVIAIENARLYQQVHNIAVLEERDRLAREMHDELAQALGFLNLKASLTMEQLSGGATESALDGLQEIKKIARETYINTRETIFNLRNTAAVGAGMLAFLREYLAEYSLHYGLEAHLEVEDPNLAEFPPDVALQINCIIQESLTNIRKHAHAAHAWVRFERQGDQARIVIQDDGRGFDPQQTWTNGKEHFGLHIMRERAESVGANLELVPHVGHGTRVVISVPSKKNS